MELKNFLQNLSEAIENRKLDSFDLVSQMMEVKELNEFEKNLSSFTSEINLSDYLCKDDIYDNSQLTTGVQQFNKGFLSLENFRRGHIDVETFKKTLVYFRSAAIALPEFGDFIKVYHILALMELKAYDDIYKDFSFNLFAGLNEKGINDIFKIISLFTLAATASMLLSCNPLLKKSSADTGNIVTNDNHKEYSFDAVNPLNNSFKSFNAIEDARPVFDKNNEYVPFSKAIEVDYYTIHLDLGYFLIHLNEKKEIDGKIHHRGFLQAKDPLQSKLPDMNDQNNNQKIPVDIIQERNDYKNESSFQLGFEGRF